MQYLRTFLPSLFLAASVIVGTLVAVLTADSHWAAVSGPLLLALAVLAADLWQARRLGSPLRPSPGALIVAGAVVLAGLIIGVDAPKQVQQFMPILGAVTVVAINSRVRTRRVGRLRSIS